MRKHAVILPLLASIVLTSTLAQPTVLWKAFNDYRPGATTHPNASIYDLRVTGEGGPLRNIDTGEDLTAVVEALVEGTADPDNFGANSPVNAGSPADKLFNGFVEIGNDGLPGIRSSTETKLILNFTGLNPAKRYNFRGTVSRGGNYNDRWSLFGVTGVDAYVNAHEDGSVNQNIFTKATFPGGTLEPYQVALNTGDNKVGSLVGWDNLEPGEDGIISIEAQQYTGSAPFGNPSAAAYAYGFTAIYLAEIESTGILRIVENPANKLATAGSTAAFAVVANSPQTITYQWQKAAPGTTTFTDIPGANQASYTTPTLVVADSETKYRVVMTSGTSTATSAEAMLTVDGSIPTVSAAKGSVNFNAVYLTFSEPMKLAQMATASHYQVSGGITVNSAVALDPTHAKLLTTTQPMNTSFTVTVNDVEDIAGNKVANNSTATFRSFAVVANAVGVEVWKNITGGAVIDLRNDLRYPLEPDIDYATSTLDSTLVIPDGPDNTYGGRFRAWLTPEEAGEYEFFLRADDQGEFRISTDDSFETLDDINIEPTAADTLAGDPFQEPGFDLSTSVPIALEQGKKYAVQAIWKESNGNDHLQVAWRKVGDPTTADLLQPIPSKFLSYYGPSTTAVEPRITRVSRDAGKVVVEYVGTGLQSTTDLVSWTDVTDTTNPYSVTPAPNENKFFRAKGQ